MAKDLVNDLYKFLKGDVTNEQLFEADKKFRNIKVEVVPLAEERRIRRIPPKLASEGRLPADPSSNPEGYMKTLMEDEKKEDKKEEKEDKKEAGEIKPAEETPENKDTKQEKDLDKATPEIKKEKEMENQTDAEKPKEVKQEQKMGEGKVPKDPSSNPEGSMKDIKEATPREKELTSLADEAAAKQLAAKYQGGRVVPDAAGKQYIVMIPENTVIKEEATVTVATDGKETTVDIGAEGTTVQTKDTAEVAPEAPVEPAAELPAESPEAPKEEIPAEEEKEEKEEDEEVVFTESQVTEMAEKIFIYEFLQTKPTLTEKEKAFVTSVKKAKIPKKSQKAVEAKLAQMKEKK